MVKHKSNARHQASSKNRLILFIALMVGLVAISVCLLFLAPKKTNVTNNSDKTSVATKNALLDVQNIYGDVSGTLNKKEVNKRPPENVCSSSKAEFGSTTYYCGPRAVMDIKNIDQASYVAYFSQLKEIVKNTDTFRNLKIEEPVEVSYVDGLASTISASYGNSDLSCSIVWEFLRQTSTALLSINCSGASATLLYPLSQ